MQDFTLHTYKYLLETLLQSGRKFYTVEEYCDKKPREGIILRHDVDLLPRNALHTALLENREGIRGTYYFRIVPKSNKADIIRRIRDLGHEIGYHYEDLSHNGGNIDKAYGSFCRNLEYFRQFYPVRTICMHGSPMSRWDSRDIWQKYSYHDSGIICEPYLDIDFNNILYLTDTGRRWDGWRVSIRDKMPQQEAWVREGFVFRTSFEIINVALSGTLPSLIMFTIHPQRWTNRPVLWIKELVSQGIKNRVKYLVVKGKSDL